MLKALIYTRFAAMFSYFLRSSKRKKKMSPFSMFGMAALAVYIIGAVGMMFGMMFSQLCGPFHELGIDWLYFAMAGITAAALMFIGSVFITQTQIYEAKDNELLLSMPIPPKYILASRMIMLIMFNLIYGGAVLIPAGIIYGIKVGFSVLGIISFIIIGFLLALLMLSISCVIGWLLAFISSRIRKKSLFTMIFSIAFLAAYFMIFSKINTYMTMIIQNGDAIARSIRNSALPIFWLGDAIVDGNVMSLLLFALCAIIPFVIIYFILSLSFIKIATEKRGFTKIKYNRESLSVSSAKIALLKKELRHFIGSPMYMLNGSLGVIITVVGAAALLVRHDMIYSMIGSMSGFASLVIPAAIAALCFISSTNIISAPSVSLEGKNIWIAQSSPVPCGDILMAKVNMHLVVTAPALFIAQIFILIVLFISPTNLIEYTPLEIILLIIVPQLFNFFCAMFGLIINLHFPKFDWISETAAVKQSMSTLIAMFGTFGIALIPVIVCIASAAYLDITITIALFTLLLTAADVLMYRYINSKGAKIFAQL